MRSSALSMASMRGTCPIPPKVLRKERSITVGSPSGRMLMKTSGKANHPLRPMSCRRRTVAGITQSGTRAAAQVRMRMMPVMRRIQNAVAVSRKNMVATK